jgi:hypothetical protein
MEMRPMRSRVYQFLTAGIFALCAPVVLSGPVRAQTERGGTPEAAAPDGPARGNVAPSPQGPEQPAPEADAQAGPEEPGIQHGCPDQRRPLQLIV